MDERVINELLIRLEVIDQKIKFILENGLKKEQEKLKDDVLCLKENLQRTNTAIEKINNQLTLQFRLIILLLTSIIGLFLTTILKGVK